MYFDIDDFFLNFLNPISVVLVPFHTNHVGYVSFPKIVVVIATRIVFGWQIYITVNTIEFDVLLFFQILQF